MVSRTRTGATLLSAGRAGACSVRSEHPGRNRSSNGATRYVGRIIPLLSVLSARVKRFPGSAGILIALGRRHPACISGKHNRSCQRREQTSCPRPQCRQDACAPRESYNCPAMVHIRLFASLREAAGQDEIELPWQNVSAAKDVFEELIKRFPALERFRPVTLVAVNEVYGNWETPVAPGDRIAFFPPVSGGSR